MIESFGSRIGCLFGGPCEVQGRDLADVRPFPLVEAALDQGEVHLVVVDPV